MREDDGDLLSADLSGSAAEVGELLVRADGGCGSGGGVFGHVCAAGPESSPELDAWRGTEATVSRGAEADRRRGRSTMATSSRWRRGWTSARGNCGDCLAGTLGAAPIIVAQTRRILLAKQLIHQTDLSMIEVAMASGFGSVRRFNETFQRMYERPAERAATTCGGCFAHRPRLRCCCRIGRRTIGKRSFNSLRRGRLRVSKSLAALLHRGDTRPKVAPGAPSPQPSPRGGGERKHCWTSISGTQRTNSGTRRGSSGTRNPLTPALSPRRGEQSGKSYSRVIEFDGVVGSVHVEHVPDQSSLAVTVRLPRLEFFANDYRAVAATV